MSKSLSKKQGISNIEAIIQRAVKSGIEAGRSQAERSAVDTYKATERRLYALPTLIKRVEDNKQRLEELKQIGAPEKSKDIMRFVRTGVRLDADEILVALIANIKTSIAADEEEIITVQRALKNISEDIYYLAVKGKYIDKISDDDIAKQIPCDRTTVCRNRGRLVRTLAIWLYGVQAV